MEKIEELRCPGCRHFDGYNYCQYHGGKILDEEVIEGCELNNSYNPVEEVNEEDCGDTVLFISFLIAIFIIIACLLTF